jgi:hypothetical protein
MKHKATAGALRAASEIEPNPALRQSIPKSSIGKPAYGTFSNS